MLRIYEYAFLLGSIQCPDCVNRQLGALSSYQATSAHELRSFVLHHIIKVRLIEITLVLMVVVAHQLDLRAEALVAAPQAVVQNEAVRGLLVVVGGHRQALRVGVLVAEVVVLPVEQVAGVEYLNN